MQFFTHIVAELKHGNWHAWFTEQPHVVCDGEDWACAVAMLIDLYGSPELEWRRIVALEGKSWEGHAEFLIPQLRSGAFPPAMSLN